MRVRVVGAIDNEDEQNVSKRAENGDKTDEGNPSASSQGLSVQMFAPALAQVRLLLAHARQAKGL